jgi:hypothetical protein
MINLQDVSEAAIKKAQEIMKAGPTSIEKDLTTGSGFNAYDLQPLAILLASTITPWRNNIPRVQNKRGGTSSEWRSISALVTGATDPFVTSEGAKANKINYSATPFTAAFAEMGLGDSVTWAAQDASMGFEGDLKARGVTNLLFALMQMEEQAIGFGRIADLGSVTAPTCTVSNSGGSIATGTYKMIARAITGLGDGTRTRGKKSSATTQSAITGPSGSMTGHTAWVEGAIAYEWYVDDGASGTSTRQATTGINSVALTALTTTDIAVPADNVANTLGMNGLIVNFTAALGASVTTLAAGSDGVGTDFTLDNIDAANKAVWDAAKANPENIWMNSTQLMRATNLVLAANGAPTLFVQAASDEMAQLTGGYMLAKYVNKSTGRLQNVRVHPYLPSGTMLAYSNTIPFPTGGDMVGIDIETSRDYQQVDYALTARRYDFEVFCRECLRPKFPGGAWVLRNCSAKTSA